MDKPLVDGIITHDIEYDVYYFTNDYSLTIEYIYEDGSEASPTFFEVEREGDTYHVDSPKIDGYNPSVKVIEGINPGGDLRYKVIYVSKDKKLIDIADLETPLGLGEIQMHVGVCYE